MAIAYHDTSLWSSPFAELQPISIAACRALQHRYNKRHRKPLCNPAKTNVMPLTLGMIMGRQCLTFGASRASDFTFPSQDGVDEIHFTLKLDVVAQTLVITDTSTTGVWIKDEQGRTLLLYRASRVVSGVVEIRVGKILHYSFSIRVASVMRDLCNARANSVRKLSCHAIPEKRRRSSVFVLAAKRAKVL